jgi:hypothetical protein
LGNSAAGPVHEQYVGYEQEALPADWQCLRKTRP